MRKIILFLFLILALAACGQKENNQFAEINGEKLSVEIVDTDESRYKGLSGRESLCANCGMLFKFDNKKTRTFVMRNMNFPIDIIWIEDNIVIGISENLPPEGSDYKNLYKSPGPANEVLEVNTGFSQKNNIKIGDKINYSL